MPLTGLPNPDRRLLPGVRAWLAIFAGLAVIDAATWGLVPHLTDSNAYSWVRIVAPQPAWAALAAASALGSTAALIFDRPGRRWPADLARVSLLAYAAFTATVGLSIAILTLDGAHGALTGTVKWWLPAVTAARILTLPSLVHGDDHLVLSAINHLRHTE